MSPEFWGFLALRRREPQDGSSKAVTAAVPDISPQLTVAVPEISPQLPSGTNHPSFSRDAVELEQAADADVSTPKDTCTNPTAEAKLVSPETIAKVVPIGDGNALVPAYLLKTINWNVHKIATRKLLQSVFGRRVLATHNLTGKVSPAFPDKMPKAKLDEALVNDIVQTVAERCNVTENPVRTCITIKCADEGKWLRKQLTKLKAKKKEDLEKKRKAEEKKLKMNSLNLKT
ncbi:hypothetical protein ABMA27_005075 [Loxostege sticticalis]|uniref:BEN domain-containing protein n=1 Tax=Loxostege sticticalis TaxID=481309 RepID=A0ABR3HLS0_LOXSC